MTQAASRAERTVARGPVARGEPGGEKIDLEEPAPVALRRHSTDGPGEPGAPHSGPERGEHLGGRILDSAGRAVHGANITVTPIARGRRDDLSSWLDAIQRRRFAAGKYYLTSLQSDAGRKHLTTTDADGRFELPAFGKELLLSVTVEGPGIASTSLTVATALTKPVLIAGAQIFGREIVATVPTSQPLSGKVFDAKDRRPLAGVEIRAYRPPDFDWQATADIRTTSDVDGCFVLRGLPSTWSGDLLLIPKSDQPYLQRAAAVPKRVSGDQSPGRIPMEIGLHRGVLVKGRISEKGSGGPVTGLNVRYSPLAVNPFARALEESDWIPVGGLLTYAFDEIGVPGRSRTAADGSYQLVALPGPGLVRVALADSPYVQEGFASIDASGHTRIHTDHTLPSSPAGTVPTPVSAINPYQGETSLRVNFKLDPGGNTRVRVVDGHGRPVAGTEAAYQMFYERPRVLYHAGPEFSIPASPEANEQRLVLIRHSARGLGRAVRFCPRDELNTPLTIALESMGSISGRVVEADGSAGVAVIVQTSVSRMPSLRLNDVGTDRDGKFKITDVPVGCHFEVTALVSTVDAHGGGTSGRFATARDPVSVTAGETADIGTIKFDDVSELGIE
jgi:hypothetical protein